MIHDELSFSKLLPGDTVFVQRIPPRDTPRELSNEEAALALIGLVGELGAGSADSKSEESSSRFHSRDSTETHYLLPSTMVHQSPGPDKGEVPSVNNANVTQPSLPQVQYSEVHTWLNKARLITKTHQE